ncbi:MAG: ACT domain-containing protein [Deltaproteobacteria bacterium]|nr:ACT domain-containing protein [Deltaproteobacteria bacterium]
MKNLVLTLIGPDRPGLVESVAQTIAAGGGNWLESRMAHLAGQFAGILRVEAPSEKADDLVSALRRLEDRGLRLVVQPAVAPSIDADSRSLELELVGQDRPGIVKEISQLLAGKGVNVESLQTDRLSAPMSGELLFSATAHVRVPNAVSVAELRGALERLAQDLMVEIRLADE